MIANIGRSPTFEGQENSINIVEAHIINRKKKDDFYHEEMKVGEFFDLQSTNVIVNRLNSFIHIYIRFSGIFETRKKI